MRHGHRQRGFSLILVLGMMALAGGVVVVLTYQAGQMQREYQWDRLDSDLRRVAASAEAFARIHAAVWKASPPTGVIALDVSRLLEAGVAGEVNLTVDRREAAVTCRVDVRLGRGRLCEAKHYSIALD